MTKLYHYHLGFTKPSYPKFFDSYIKSIDKGHYELRIAISFQKLVVNIATLFRVIHNIFLSMYALYILIF